MAQYDPTIALGLAEYSNFAYFRKEALKRQFADAEFEFLEGEGDRVDTQAFMITNAKGVILAFRGTQQWKDLATDLWSVTTTDHEGSSSRQIHKGFCAAYDAVRPKIRQEIKNRAPSRVFVTGHSLGGALATLAAIHIAQEFSPLPVTMYNFGSPRLGDCAFAEFYNNKVIDSFRVVVPRDFVPHLPVAGWWSADYRHVDQEHKLGNVALPFLSHDLVQSYLPQLSDEVQSHLAKGSDDAQSDRSQLSDDSPCESYFD